MPPRLGAMHVNYAMGKIAPRDFLVGARENYREAQLRAASSDRPGAVSAIRSFLIGGDRRGIANANRVRERVERAPALVT